MVLFRDSYDRATKARREEVVGPTLSAKARDAALVVERYFADKMKLLPEEVQPKHPIMTPKDAAPHVRHFVTTDLVEHLGNGLMKRALAAAVRTAPSLAAKVEETRRQANEEETDAIAKARKMLPGKLSEPYKGPQVQEDERKVLIALLNHPTVRDQHPPLLRMYRRDPSIVQEHFKNAAKLQRQDPTVARQLLANRQKKADGQELAA